jgi:PAS domain S-box-containing protein
VARRWVQCRAETDVTSLANATVDLTNLVERLPIALYVCEAPSGQIRFYNHRAADLWGRAPRLENGDERFCGSSRLFRLDGAFLPHAESPMAVALRRGDDQDEEVVIERPDGSRLRARVSVAALRDAEGRIVGAAGTLQNVSGIAQDEEYAARLAAIVASADDAIVSKTLDGHITSWNRAAERMFGYSEAEVVGKPITLIIPHERLHEEDEILSRLRRGESIEHFETERLTKDGRLIPISLTISPVRDARGRIVGASKVARDVSEQRRLRRELEGALAREQCARAEYQAANRAKDEFLAMLAHELRNPVAVVVNALAVLDDGRDTHPQRMRARSLMRHQTEHLAKLLDDLLDVARITGGRVELDHQHVDLRASVEQAVESERPRFEGKRQRVLLSLADESIAVRADPVRLHQIFCNLLNNAWKYTPIGGSIWVTLGTERDEAVLAIRDDGGGLESHALESIFDLFVQANPTLARTEGGLGIGLTLVRRLVELHGGSVRAHSEGPGRGAEFVVRLPLARAAVPSPAPAPAPAAFKSQRVLVVEDNDDGREALATLLRLWGHEVLEAATGAQGVEIAMTRSPSVVLLDIGLPDLDGYEVARQLRQKLGGGVRLVALSGYGQAHDRARSRDAGFDVHLVKPVDPPALASLLQEIA